MPSSRWHGTSVTIGRSPSSAKRTRPPPGPGQVGVGDDRPDEPVRRRTSATPGGGRRVEVARDRRDRDAPRRGPGAHLAARGHHDDRERPGGAEHLVGHPLRELGAASARACGEAGLADRERPDRDHDALASRGGSGTMGLRMLPSVDATYVVARDGVVPAPPLGIRWTIEGAQRIPVRGR